MKFYKYFAGIVVLLLVVWSANTSAKDKCVPKVYAFGFSASFNDSIVYFTDIHEIDSVWINDKNNFLQNRSDYSYQLKHYFETKGLSHQTCIISYALKRKDIEKKYNKIRNKYIRKGKFDIRNIDSKDFRFTSVNYD